MPLPGLDGSIVPEPIGGSLAGQNMPVLTCQKTQKQTLLCSGLFLPSRLFGRGQGVVWWWFRVGLRGMRRQEGRDPCGLQG